MVEANTHTRAEKRGLLYYTTSSSNHDEEILEILDLQRNLIQAYDNKKVVKEDRE